MVATSSQPNFAFGDPFLALRERERTDGTPSLLPKPKVHDALRRWSKDGTLPPPMRVGGVLRWDPKAVRSSIEAHSANTE